MDRQQEYVLRTVEERDIRFIRLWFTDVLGFLKSVAITAAELQGAFEDGIGFDGSAIDGFARVQEADMVARPDAGTFQVLPWRPNERGVARMFCDIVTPTGEPFTADPRQVLRRQLDRAAELGLQVYVRPEIEFFLFAGSDDPTPLDAGSYFDMTPLDVQQDYRRQVIDLLEQVGVSVESSHHEVAPSQHEIDLRSTDALTMADNIMTFRLVAKEVALGRGVYASFMPKPIEGEWGSAMHTHITLHDGDRNVLDGPDGRGGLSDVGQQFLAGLLRYAPELTAVTNQWVNSYKRLVPGFEAPVNVGWGTANRSALVRIPRHATEPSLEYRAPDPATNPYLCFAVLIAAGLRGIEQEEQLPSAIEDNAYELTDEQRADGDIRSLPVDLGEALRAMEGSMLVAETLGPHLFEYFLANKRQEWAAYTTHVTAFELERHLPLL